MFILIDDIVWFATLTRNFNLIAKITKLDDNVKLNSPTTY